MDLSQNHSDQNLFHGGGVSTLQVCRLANAYDNYSLENKPKCIL